MSQIERKINRLIEINGADVSGDISAENRCAQLMRSIAQTIGVTNTFNETESLLEQQFQALKEINDLLGYAPAERLDLSIRERIYLELVYYNDGQLAPVDRSNDKLSQNERILRELGAFNLDIIPGGLNPYAGETGAYVFDRESDGFNPETGELLGPDEERVRDININGRSYKAQMRFAEGESTNQMRYSEELDNADWSKINASVNANVSDNPFGEMIADEIVEDTSSGEHFVFDTPTVLTPINDYTFSFYVKRGSGARNLQIRFEGGGWQGGGEVRRDFNLDSGFVGGGQNSTGRLVDLGDGWFFVSMKSNFDSGSSTQCRISLLNGSSRNYAGDGTSSLYVWAAQMEQKSVATSYIKTSGAPVTRLADDSMVSSFSKPLTEKGTMVAVVLPYGGTMADRTTPRAYETNGDSTLWSARGNNLVMRRRDAVSDNQESIATSSFGTLFTVAQVWDGVSQTHKVYLNGVNTDTLPTEAIFDSVLGAELQLGNNNALSRAMGSWVFYLIFEENLSDAEIATLNSSVSVP